MPDATFEEMYVELLCAPGRDPQGWPTPAEVRQAHAERHADPVAKAVRDYQEAEDLGERQCAEFNARLGPFLPTPEFLRAAQDFDRSMRELGPGVDVRRMDAASRLFLAIQPAWIGGDRD